jgi:hypothetical protein
VGACEPASGTAGTSGTIRTTDARRGLSLPSLESLWSLLQPPHPACATVVIAMDPHRLAKERSIAYHRAIAERLPQHPEILEMARRRVASWMATSEPPFYARRWEEILADDVSSIAGFLVERSELAEELRSASPFAGALRPQERWKIWRETRERFVSEL